jgi:YHS domain-containing protein
MNDRIRGIVGGLFVLLPCVASQAADDTAKGRREDQAALKTYGALVGSWRGSGQPERGKVRGAWRESANWAWKLTQDTAALAVTVKDGKYLRSAILRPGPEPKTFVLDATLANKSKRSFTGKRDGKKALVLTALESGEGLRRITLTPLHDTRLLVKLEAQAPDSKAYYQLGEVGYTREGVAFAVGETGPICIVTEGRGTIPVTYKGKTYYVCCTGCRDLFKDDPEGVLAEAAEREKENAKK